MDLFHSHTDQQSPGGLGDLMPIPIEAQKGFSEDGSGDGKGHRDDNHAHHIGDHMPAYYTASVGTQGGSGQDIVFIFKATISVRASTWPSRAIGEGKCKDQWAKCPSR